MLQADVPRQRRVVIVGPSADCREVLSAALARRGLATFEAKEAGQGLRLVCQHEPDVVVLDGEAPGANDQKLQAQLDAELHRSRASLIVLGPLRSQQLLPQEQVAKPYHFAPLVHTIEALAAAKAA